jgi:hypothetical protein
LLSLVVLGLATGIVLGLAASPASAQPGRTAEAEQACTPDAMRLCGEFIPDVGRITACMKSKRSQLTSQCRAFFKPTRKAKKAKRKRAA